MAGEKRNLPSGRRRPAPTIELSANEINSDGYPEGKTASANEPPGSERDHPGSRTQNPRTQSKSWLPPGSLAPLLAAAIAACAVVVVLLLALWIAGSIRGRDDGNVAIAFRLSQAEQQLRDLASRPNASGVDPKALDELSTRLARTEGAVTARIAAVETAAKSSTGNASEVGGRIDELSGAIRDMRSQTEFATRRLEELANGLQDARGLTEAAGRRIDELAKAVGEARTQASAAAAAARNPPDISRADLEKLSSRLAAIEQNTKAAEAEIAKRVARAVDDRTSRLAIVATSLRSLVERGEPFAEELNAAKALAPDAGNLAPLESFAESGVPSSAVLSRELTSIIPMLVRAAVSVGPEGGFFVKLQANAERIVRIRPVGDVEGDDAASIIARVESRAAMNDVSGALAELAKLPPDVRAPAEGWIRKAKASQDAAGASRKFASDWLRALGKSGL